MKKALIAIFPLIFCFAAFAAPPAPMNHSGTWWQSKSIPFKSGFLSGYKDGQRRANPQAAYPTLDSRQIIQGLDHFYKDFRNVNVQVEDAILYVADELSGKSDADLAAELQTLRKNAAAAAAKAPQSATEDNE
jgi:hypothetical protein